MDGGLRVWDLRTSDRTTELEGLHKGGITSVQFSPTNATQVLTNGKDHCLKLIDMRTGSAICTMKDDADFCTPHNWSSAAMSPDGHFAASVSGADDGQLIVWNVSDGSVFRKIKGHDVGAGGLAWGSGGTSGQQVASVDRSGQLILWA
jgi:WD40 repeat protein